MINVQFWKEDLGAYGDKIIIDVGESPLKLQNRFDERLSEAYFETWDIDCPYDLPIPAWTKCRITDDRGQEYNYFVQSYDDEVFVAGDVSAGKPKRKIRISLIEQIAVTQQIYPDSLCFSNGIDASGKVVTRTIADVLSRVREQLWTVPKADRALSKYAPLYFTWDSSKDYFNKTAPELFFTDKSLFEIFVEIGEVIGGFPSIRWAKSYNNGSEYWLWLLEYRMWGDNTTTHWAEDTKIVQSLRHTGIDGYANVLVSNLKNLQNMSLDGENTIVEPCETEYMAVSTEDYVTEITATNAVFRTKKPIAKILSMGFAIFDSMSARFHYSIEFPSTMDAPVFVESTVWQTYPDRSVISDFLSTAYKNTTMYYIQGDNTIYNIDDGTVYSACRRIFESIRVTDPYEDTITNGTRLYAKIKYIPYQDAKVKTYKPDSTLPLTEIYNQSANVVSSNAIGNNMQGLVERMEGRYKMIQKVYGRGESLMRIGDYYDGDVITEANYEYTNRSISAIFTVAPFNRRSPFVSIPNNIRLWAIPKDKIADRDLHYSEIVEVEINPTMASTNNGSLTIKGLGVLRNYQTSETVPSLAYVAWKNTASIISDSDTQSNNYALAPLSALPIGKSVIMTWGAVDNASMGNRTYSKTAAQPHRGDVQSFVAYDEKALFFNCKIGNIAPQTYDFDNSLLPLGGETRNQNFEFSYPASNKKQYTDCQSFVDFGQWYIQKDLRERIKFNYQLDFVGKNGTIVYDKGVTLNRLCTNTATTFRIFKNRAVPYSSFERRIFADTVVEVQDGSIGSYDNLAITDQNLNLLFATNTSGTATSLNLSFVNKKREWLPL